MATGSATRWKRPDDSPPRHCVVDMARVLALDHGTTRIGVAVSDPLGLTAQAHSVLDAGPGLMDRIGNLVSELGVERIVVGLPVGLDGSEGAAGPRGRGLSGSPGGWAGPPG